MLDLSQADCLKAITDPAYHRALMFAEADDIRAEQLGRPLVFPEAQAEMPWPQVQCIDRWEEAIADKEGEILTCLSSRQTMKNETEAMAECRLLSIFQGIPGSTYIRTAPTWKPQIVQSKIRLEKHIDADPLLDQSKVRQREGFIVQYGKGMLQFMSGGATSNVVGATASIGLSIDEAHKIDANKFEEDFMPFTASTNAPCIMWGVAADELDLLHEYRLHGEGTDRSMVYPWDIWAELSEPYAKHCENRKSKLGESHPIWLTQYCLKAVQSAGAYLKDHHRTALFSGDHPQLSAPRAGMAYGILIDIGGESELDADDEAIRAEEPTRDSTCGVIFEYDSAQAVDHTTFNDVRLVTGFHWTGKQHLAVIEGDRDIIKDLSALAKHWQVRSGVCDARGVGHAVAKALHRRIPCILPYEASQSSVSEDCYDLLARLNAGKVTAWRADPDADDFIRELGEQCRHTRYTITGHELLKIVKPTGTGSTGLHIDMVKMLTYLHRAMDSSHSGLLDHMRAELARRKEKEDGKEAR